MSKTSVKAKSRNVTRGSARKNTNRTGVVNTYIHRAAGSPGKAVIDGFNLSRIIAYIQSGLPIRELDDLQASFDIDTGRLASMLGISKATLHRRKAQRRLEPAESDRLLRFARLMGKAVAVFGGIPEARQWLNSSQFGLSGSVPLDYAETEPGAREVENLLGRIEFGVYS